MRRSRAFDAEAWRISGNDGGVNSWRASRHLMVNDLLAQGYLDGATRAEVLERLIRRKVETAKCLSIFSNRPSWIRFGL